MVDIDNEPLTDEDKVWLRIKNLDESGYADRSELYEEMIGTHYDHLSEKQIREKIVNIEAAVSKFKREYARKKLKQAYLIGMTADAYNSRYNEDSLAVHHIFIDEGGYMPVNKVYGMCRPNVPITIIGDPMQLPPVAEMEDKIKEDGEHEKVLLYDMNAFYLETLFNEGYKGLKRAYFDDKPPKIPVPKVDLTQTYRFGEQLAGILDRFVYQSGFKSAIGEGGFRLEYLDAVNKETP